MLQEEERDPDLVFRDIAKFGILQIAGLFHVACELMCAVNMILTVIHPTFMMHWVT